MTRRDFRTRRNLFKGAIRKHREFESFYDGYRDRRRNLILSRLLFFISILVLIALIIFTIG